MFDRNHPGQPESALVRLALLCLIFAGTLCDQANAGGGSRITVGFGTNKPPYIIESRRSGLEVELVTAAFRAAGVEVAPYFAPQQRLFTLLAHHHIAAITTINKASGVPAFYSDSHITYRNYAISLAVRDDIAIGSIADLGKYRVTAFQGARTMLGPAYRAAVDQSPDYSEQAQQSLRNSMLFHRRVDVVVADRRIFEYFRQHADDDSGQQQPVRYFDIFPPTRYKLGFDKKSDCDRFNNGLAAIRQSGEYDSIMKKYASY